MSNLGPVGVIGTGQLGLCFVERIRSANIEVRAYDIDPDALSRARNAGAKAFDSPGAAANGCTAVLTCVTGPAEVRECSIGPAGIRAGLSGGSMVIDTSTSLPETDRELAQVFAEANIAYIDAPVSRGIPAARAGTLSIMLGAASPNSVEQALPILALLGSDIVTVGRVGDGHTVKLLNMMLMGSHLVACAEALGLAATKGIDASAMVAALDRADSASYMSSNHLPRYAITEDYNSGFTLKLMAKDLGLARKLADALAVPVPLSDRVWHEYNSAMTHLGDVDNMRVVPYLSALAAGRDPEEARTRALSGHLPNVGQAARSAAIAEICATVTTSNAIAANEALRIAAAAQLSLQKAFSVIDVSSGASRYTAQLALGKPVPHDSETATRRTTMPDDGWTPILDWSTTLSDISRHWSHSYAADSANALFH